MPCLFWLSAAPVRVQKRRVRGLLGVAYSIAVVGAERTRVLERTHTDIR